MCFSSNGLPNGLPWGQAIMPYVSNGSYKPSDRSAWEKLFNGLYRCPVDKRRNAAWSYGKNVWFELSSSETGEAMGTASGPMYFKLSQIRRPTVVVEFGELTSDGVFGSSAADYVMAHFWLMGSAPEIDTKRHGAGSSYTFLDGHALKLTFTKTFDLDKRIDDWNPGTAQ